MPDVRVVIPTFNRASEVIEAIRTALQQSFLDLEVVVVDDGSSDGTVARLVSVFAGDDRVRVLEMAHAGYAAAINTGIEAPGAYRYVAFLDSDDRWTPDHLLASVRLLEKEPALDLVFTAFDTEDCTGTWTPDELDTRRRRVYRPLELAVRTIGQNSHVLDPDRTFSAMVRGWMSPGTPTVVVRASSVPKEAWFDSSLLVLADVDFFLRLASRRQPWAFISTVQCTVRFLGDNLTRSHDLSSPVSLARQRSALQVCERKFAACVSEDRSHVGRELARQAYLVGQCCSEQEDWTGARMAYRRALWVSPQLTFAKSLFATYLPSGIRGFARWFREHV